MCVVILSVLSTLHQEARMSAGILGTEQSKSENQSEMLSNKTWALGRRLKVRSSPLDGGGAGGGGAWRGGVFKPIKGEGGGGGGGLGGGE